jgi:hypothetical protein
MVPFAFASMVPFATKRLSALIRTPLCKDRWSRGKEWVTAPWLTGQATREGVLPSKAGQAAISPSRGRGSRSNDSIPLMQPFGVHAGGVRDVSQRTAPGTLDFRTL